MSCTYTCLDCRDGVHGGLPIRMPLMARVEVGADTLGQLLLMSFRYALGRRSAGVGYVADLLTAHRDLLADWQRQQIVGDIERAITNGHAGMDCDVQDWRHVAEALR